MLRRLYKPALFVLFGCYLFGFVFVAWQSSKSPPYFEKHAATKQQPTQKNNENGAKVQSLWVPVDSIGLYTLVLAAFTGLLVGVAGLQILFLLRSDIATRKTITLTQRPKLRVRNIVIERPQALGRKLNFFQKGHVVRGQLYVANIGGTPATILEGYCSVWWNQYGEAMELPMQRPYEGKDGNFVLLKQSLSAGESTTGLFQSSGLVDTDNIIGVDSIMGSRAYVMGWIKYADDFGVKRSTSFCRQYKSPGGGANGRFYAVEDPDYEHEE
jgi:hypothetical protein